VAWPPAVHKIKSCEVFCNNKCRLVSILLGEAYKPIVEKLVVCLAHCTYNDLAVICNCLCKNKSIELNFSIVWNEARY
jgi:hypothetical protein